MSELQEGQIIQTKGFVPVKVLEQLGEGGQGIVYKADYGGKQKALKWYFKNKMKNPEKFYDNIKNNIDHGAPTDAFLWPEDITEWLDGTFGYIMPLRPPEYEDFSKYLLAKVRFKSLRTLINTALNIVEGFAALHREGYNYQDLNDGNFFVNFDTGDVLICDNDNVMGHGYNSGIAGKCRYMAPEVVTHDKLPDKQTDRFSLAVVLFLLLFGNHPLEGKATNPPCLTEELEKKYYGTDPVFILDPVNKDNIPIRGIHKSVIAKWPLYPQYIRDIFIEVFGYEQLHGREPRVMEKVWLETFIRLRSEIVPCSCGGENFADPTKGVTCSRCGKQINVPAYLKFEKLNVPLYPAMNLFACHTVSDSEDFKTSTAEVIVSKNNPGNMGIRNLSDVTWYVTGADGVQAPRAKGEVLKIASGLSINFGKNLIAEIVGN
ncbi:MAG: serine/threonine-protein kinase [Clostridiales Family XIII bacterium]|nr:serine/threonine-protein kinase [Clostridiales Family XIII bacterium]